LNFPLLNSPVIVEQSQFKGFESREIPRQLTVSEIRPDGPGNRDEHSLGKERRECDYLHRLDRSTGSPALARGNSRQAKGLRIADLFQGRDYRRGF
jgi:hypothetical protein